MSWLLAGLMTWGRLIVAIFAGLSLLHEPSLVIAADEGKVEEPEVISTSPDKRFVLLRKWSTESCSVDLAEQKTRKVVLRVAESAEDSNRLDTEALWSADSKRLAMMVSTMR